MDNRYAPRSNHYNLFPRHKPTYNNLCPNTVSNKSGDELLHYMLTHHSVKKVIKIYGEAGVTILIDELKELHSREVLEPKMRDELTIDERKNPLRYLMFLKQRNSGQIERQGCAEGSPQHKFMSKEDTSSSMIAV